MSINYYLSRRFGGALFIMENQKLIELPYKIDLPATEKKLKDLKTETELFRYSKQLQNYATQGVINITPALKKILHKRLDEIYYENL